MLKRGGVKKVENCCFKRIFSHHSMSDTSDIFRFIAVNLSTDKIDTKHQMTEHRTCLPAIQVHHGVKGRPQGDSKPSSPARHGHKRVTSIIKMILSTQGKCFYLTVVRYLNSSEIDITSYPTQYIFHMFIEYVLFVKHREKYWKYKSE